MRKVGIFVLNQATETWEICTDNKKNSNNKTNKNFTIQVSYPNYRIVFKFLGVFRCNFRLISMTRKQSKFLSIKFVYGSPILEHTTTQKHKQCTELQYNLVNFFKIFVSGCMGTCRHPNNFINSS